VRNLRRKRLARLQFDCTRSVGGLFVDTLRLAGERIEGWTSRRAR